MRITSSISNIPTILNVLPPKVKLRYPGPVVLKTRSVSSLKKV
jgi:hypothetical protein